MCCAVFVHKADANKGKRTTCLVEAHMTDDCQELGVHSSFCLLAEAHKLHSSVV